MARFAQLCAVPSADTILQLLERRGGIGVWPKHSAPPMPSSLIVLGMCARRSATTRLSAVDGVQNSLQALTLRQFGGTSVVDGLALECQRTGKIEKSTGARSITFALLFRH
jgi:hypothetical protein